MTNQNQNLGPQEETQKNYLAKLEEYEELVAKLNYIGEGLSIEKQNDIFVSGINTYELYTQSIKVSPEIAISKAVDIGLKMLEKYTTKEIKMEKEKFISDLEKMID